MGFIYVRAYKNYEKEIFDLRNLLFLFFYYLRQQWRKRIWIIALLIRESRYCYHKILFALESNTHTHTHIYIYNSIIRRNEIWILDISFGEYKDVPTSWAIAYKTSSQTYVLPVREIMSLNFRSYFVLSRIIFLHLDQHKQQEKITQQSTHSYLLANIDRLDSVNWVQLKLELLYCSYIKLCSFTL